MEPWGTGALLVALPSSVLLFCKNTCKINDMLKLAVVVAKRPVNGRQDV